MTAVDFAAVLHGRRSEPGKWRALCPCSVHNGSSRKLSITEGHNGRVLVYCFAGCKTRDVMTSLGLRMADLFSGPPPTVAQSHQLVAERIERDDTARNRRRAHGAICDRMQKLEAVCDSLCAHLTRQPKDGAIAELFHTALAKLRAIEAMELGLRQ
jgi:hypothetical protein